MREHITAVIRTEIWHEKIWEYMWSFGVHGGFSSLSTSGVGIDVCARIGMRHGTERNDSGLELGG